MNQHAPIRPFRDYDEFVAVVRAMNTCLRNYLDGSRERFTPDDVKASFHHPSTRYYHLQHQVPTVGTRYGYARLFRGTAVDETTRHKARAWCLDHLVFFSAFNTYTGFLDEHEYYVEGLALAADVAKRLVTDTDGEHLLLLAGSLLGDGLVREGIFAPSSVSLASYTLAFTLDSPAPVIQKHQFSTEGAVACFYDLTMLAGEPIAVKK